MSAILKENLCPSLTNDIVAKLTKLKITSVVNLISCDLSKLRSIARTQGIDFQTLVNVKDELYGTYGPMTINARLLYETLEENRLRFKTGIEKLDEILLSGISNGQLVEVFGQTDSGKTSFCYAMIANALQNCQKKVLYLDTDLSFSINRLNQILKEGFRMKSRQRDELLSRLMVIKAFDVSTVLNIFESIHYDLNLNSGSESDFKDLCLIIIDSLSGPLSHEIKSKTFEIENEEKNRNSSSRVAHLKRTTVSLVSQMGFTIKNLIRNRSIAAIVTNSEQIASKKYWNLYCDISLKFSVNTDVTDVQKVYEDMFHPFRIIEVVKGFKKRPENKSFNKFVIDEKGLHT